MLFLWLEYNLCSYFWGYGSFSGFAYSWNRPTFFILASFILEMFFKCLAVLYTQEQGILVNKSPKSSSLRVGWRPPCNTDGSTEAGPFHWETQRSGRQAFLSQLLTFRREGTLLLPDKYTPVRHTHPWDTHTWPPKIWERCGKEVSAPWPSLGRFYSPTSQGPCPVGLTALRMRTRSTSPAPCGAGHLQTLTFPGTEQQEPASCSPAFLLQVHKM